MNFHVFFQTFSKKLKARSPDKFMDVTNDLKVTDEDDVLSCSLMIKAKNIIMKEQIWITSVSLQFERNRHVERSIVGSVQ